MLNFAAQSRLAEFFADRELSIRLSFYSLTVQYLHRPPDNHLRDGVIGPFDLHPPAKSMFQLWLYIREVAFGTVRVQTL